MRIYLLRHGIAEDQRPGEGDSDRRLTPEGRKKLLRIMEVLSAADVKLDLMISSPFTRAVETAGIAANVLGYQGEVLRSDALVPSSRPEHVWDEIRSHRDASDLMLVGHEPLFSSATAYLLGALSLLVDFKKGAVICIEFSSFGPQPKGVLRWMLTAKLAGR